MSNPNINPTTVIIPVDLAIAKTAYWRQFIADACPTVAEENLPKGVYISKNDITAMANYCNADDSILGVRAYFTLESDHRLVPDSSNVKFVMVLVKNSPAHFNGQDLMYIPAGAGMKELSPDGGGMDDSNVYDFTQPCPDNCDPTSPLYSVPLSRPFRRK
ncbi:MAG: hypothetical protein ACXVAY_01770 [Mucilaginibacter sp.]